jgi:hypothetical protein
MLPARRGEQMSLHGRAVRLGSIVLLVGVLLHVPFGSTQGPADRTPSADIHEKQAILLGIQRSIAQLEGALQATQEELRSPQGEGRREDLTQRIKTLGGKLAQLQENFNEVATGIALEQATVKPAEGELDWRQRILELLSPVLNEVRRLTTRPRELSQLRTQIERDQEQVGLAQRALDHLDQLTEQIADPVLVPDLERLRQAWEARRQDLTTQLSITTQQLEQKLRAQPPFSATVQDLVQIFFRSRGRNFFLACLAFAAFWLTFQWLYGRMQGRGVFRRQRPQFSVRLVNVVATICKVLGATLSALFVLYLFEDWVLLTLAIVFMMGLAWTSKNAIPRIWEEMLLVLNLGAVREGERVLYNGIPWLVQSLNFSALLVNPELAGGHLRLPLHDLFALRSRAFAPEEPWFPTHLEDWVLLDGQTLGKVILQTPEIVRLILLGGSRRTFPTPDFLTQSPIVLSTGFRLTVLFGLDYQHQGRITREIPTGLASRLSQELSREGYEKEIVHITVEFAAAAASSLDLHVMADFSGSAAPHYHVLTRLIQRFCVEACNDYGWIIPFPHITLHRPSATHAGLPPAEDGLPRDGRHGTDVSP